MATDDFERAEVDRLVTELARPPKPQAPRKTVVLPVGDTAAVAAPSPPAAYGRVAPGRLWTTAHLLMPATRTERRKRFTFPAAISLPEIRKRFTLLSAISFPYLRKVALQKLRDTAWGAVSVRTFVGLGVLLSAAMPYWPYSHAWSWGLVIYLCAVELVVVTGIWGAKLTWDQQLPAAHTVAVGTVIWGLGLIVAEAAPRLVYA